MSNREATQKARKYKEAFERDVRKKDVEVGEQLEHQKMVQEVGGTWEAISDEYPLLKENVRKLMSGFEQEVRVTDENGKIITKTITVEHPSGSEIDWRSTGSGVELQKNSPIYVGYEEGKAPLYKPSYGAYKTILDRVPGPAGSPSVDQNKFVLEPELEYVNNLLKQEYEAGRYCGYISFHSVGGVTQFLPEKEKIDTNGNVHVVTDESIVDTLKVAKIAAINEILGQTFMNKTNFKEYEDSGRALDEIDRTTRYPGEVLIEFSKVTGNPIGPFSDEFSYCDSVSAATNGTRALIDKMSELKHLMYSDVQVGYTDELLERMTQR